MRHAEALLAILAADPLRRRLLGLVGSLGLPDCWIGAGCIRNAVWDHRHGRPPGRPAGDVDVLWFCAGRADAARDRILEAALRRLDPSVAWSVKNQARMHRRNDDPPYASTTAAMRAWPETATAVAVRQAAGDGFEVAAPFGLDDLFALVLRPTPHFAGAKRPLCLERIAAKRWLVTWPLLRMADQGGEASREP